MAKVSALFRADEAAVLGASKKSIALRVANVLGLDIYLESLSAGAGGAAVLARKGIEKTLVVFAPEKGSGSWVWEFTGRHSTAEVDGVRLSVTLCPLTHDNAAALRRTFAHTAPRCFGTRTSAGLGDRLGVGTPGHIRAARGTAVAPFLAQQSIREMTRTGRTPAEVMDDATWGVFQEGWDEGFGSDADHLKTTADVDACVAAGFTMYTVDPGEHVDHLADSLRAGDLVKRFEKLSWAAMETKPTDMRRACLGRAITLPGDVRLVVDEVALMRAAVKYGSAVAHTAAMFRHLATRMGGRPFELEMSVDETKTPTSTFEHYFVARELRRMGVKWVSLAPRFAGDFQKGVDYRGDKKAFRKSFAEHVAVMKEIGPYKISIHSGSDKFSIYPIMAKEARGLIHVKTSGTSYLEALRVLAKVEPGLFREILEFAFARYEEDRQSYHVSARLSSIPRGRALAEGKLGSVLDLDDGRQLLHVTFGSVLTSRTEGHYVFRDRLLKALRENEEAYYAALRKHLGRHIQPFAGKAAKRKQAK